MMANVSVYCFLASYLVAFALEWTRLLRRTAVIRVVMLLFALAGLVAHTIFLFERANVTNLPPLLSSTRDWMLVLAWMGIVFYLFLTIFDRDLAIGLFLLPMVILLIGAAYFVSTDPNTLMVNNPEVHQQAVQGWAMLHASLLVFGIAGVAVGFVLSLMYLFQHRRLKHKQTLKTGLMLPSLEKLARLNRWAVILSIPMLTLGVATGVALAFLTRKESPSVSLSDPFVVGNLLIWGVMVIFFVWLLRTHRSAGKQVAWTTLWAFGFLLLTLLGLQMLTGEGSLKSWHASNVDPISLIGV